MLTYFAALRAREFTRLDSRGEAYLDYTGSGLYPESAIRWHCDALQRGVFGNPHSAHGPSRASTDAAEVARAAVLAFVDADPAQYTVVFTANASASAKLVAESFPFGPDCGFWLTADNHNSVNGIREYAKRAGASTTCLPLDATLELVSPATSLPMGPVRGLFAFPAQSNFSGVRHSLDLVARAQSAGLSVLLDAAAYLPTQALSLREVPADFLMFSLYKIVGYPTGVGALVVRHEALRQLHRPWFAGGTVEFASITHNVFARRAGAAGFEDGTPDFLALSAVPASLGFIRTVGQAQIARHVSYLTGHLRERLVDLTHSNGAPLVRLYGRGAVIAFNVLDPAGRPVPFALVEARAADARVALRGGCFCNPGAAEAAFDWPSGAADACLASTRAGFSVDRFSQCLGRDWAVGALRASLGVASNLHDVDQAVAVVAQFRR